MRSVPGVVGIAMSLMLASVVAVDASAATYEVHACRLPSGAPAPAHGWTRIGGPEAVSQINCPGGGMTSRPADGEHALGRLLGFSFTAPTGTTIVGFNRHVEGAVNMVPGAPPPWHWEQGESGTEAGSGRAVGVRVECGNCGPFTQNYDYPQTPDELSEISVALSCASQNGPGPCAANGSHFTLRWITLRLRDLMAPQVLSASGSLLDNRVPQHGERFLTLKLRDVGGGLLRTRVEVDGERFSEQAIDDNNGRCRPPFVAPVPCKLAADIELPVDTSRLSDGHHQLAVRVFDATGVNSTVAGPIQLDVDNIQDRSRLTCPAAAEGKLTRHVKTKVTRFGGWASMSGRVAGRQLPRGARVALMDHPSGARATAKTAPLRRGGRFRLRLRPRASGLVRPVLLASSGRPELCGAPIRLTVRAGMNFTVAPKRLANGQSISMRGRLLGRPVPKGGKTIVIQARARGASTWTAVSTLRSRRSGRFAFAYRFRRTFRRTTYEFRALAPRQRSYPYARGWSPVRRAVVTP